MKLSKHMISLSIHSGIAAAITYIPAVSKIVSPAATIALSVAAYVITKFFGQTETFYSSNQNKVINANKELVKNIILLAIALPIFGLSVGTASLVASHFAENIANRVVLWINPPKQKSMDFDYFS